MFDIVIKNGFIIDGTGAPGFNGSVGIKRQKIEAILSGDEIAGGTVIDAGGLAVSPGFIDSHTHSDVMFLAKPNTDIKIRQGVTTECIGNCGISTAPLRKEYLPFLKRFVEPLAFGSSLSWDWQSMGDYLDRISNPSLNVAALVGLGTVRIAVMGMDRRKPNSREMTEIKNVVRESMDQGAIGASSGLIYPPESYSETDELIEICRTVAELGGIYAVHIRNEADRLVEAVKEAIRIGRESGVSLLISHHKVGGRKNWGLVAESLEVIQKARDDGVDIHMDQYPYTAGSTMLKAILPPWVHENNNIRKHLKSKESRKKILNDFLCGIEGWQSFVELAGWENIVVASGRNIKELEGKSILEIAQQINQEPAETAFDILMEDEDSIAIFHALSEEDVMTVMKHPLVMIGSDGVPGSGKPHPRLYGTFPRVLGKYVRDRKVISLEEAVRKMTGLPAEKLGLDERGTIAKGKRADLVVFDPSRINDRSTYAEPDRSPEGIEYVLINGSPALINGSPGDLSAGEVLR